MARAADSDSATALATAIFNDPSVITGAQFVTMPPLGLTALASAVPLAGFPKDGSSFGILSSGAAASVYPEQADDSDLDETRNGGAIRGDTDQDVTILRIDVNLPAQVNCLTGLNFRFLSDEYPTFVGTRYNDAFIFEIDQSTWTTAGSTIAAPGDLAFDEQGNIISINAAGAATMTAALATGTTTGGSTRTLVASAPITPGAHSLYFSIFDQGDMILDSVVFLDNLRFGHVANTATDCKPGVVPVSGDVVTAPAPTFTDGDEPSYTIPNTSKVVYSVDGYSQGPGTYDAYAGETVTITAATSGDDLLEGPSSWTHTWAGDTGELAPVVPAPPVFTDPPGSDDDTVTIPATPGVTYYLNGDSVDAGTYPASGSTSVGAEADAGYAIIGPSNWDFYFDTAGDEPATVTAPAPTADRDAGTFTIPTSSEVRYYANGDDISAGTHNGTGTVFISAEPIDPETQLSGATAWTFTFPGAEAMIATAVAPGFVDAADGPGTITIPDVTGVNYAINGEPADPGTHSASGPVTVTATAAVGYAINGVTGWSHVFAWASAVPVTAAAPIFTDPAGSDNDTYTVPSTLGVRYLLDGDVIPSGTYPVDPDHPEVTITAVATAGYVLNGPSVFSHTFTGSSALTMTPGSPAISGVTKVGATLAANGGTWTPASVALAFQWMADGVVIPGATGQTFVLTPAELGKQISVTVAGSKDGYTPATATSPLTAVVTAGDLVPQVPTISGTAAVGALLTANPGTWQPAPVGLTYQWNRNGSPIAGATASTYTAQAADAGTNVSVSVTGSEAGYITATRTSAAVAIPAPVTPPPASQKLKATPVPKISGTAKVGASLKAKPGTWKPAPVTLAYQWYAGGIAIAGATKSSYTLQPGDKGKSVRVTVTGSKTGYQTVSKTSKATKKVSPGTLSGATPKLSGAAKVGSTVTANAGKWKPEPVNFAYQWYRSGKKISGATGSSYLLVAADKGKKISVKVTGSRDGYQKLTKASKSKKVSAGSLALGGALSTPPISVGVQSVGSILTAPVIDWNTLPVQLAYQWYRSGTVIEGARGSTYRLVAADRGKTITVEIIGVKAGYAASTTRTKPTAKVR